MVESEKSPSLPGHLLPSKVVYQSRWSIPTTTALLLLGTFLIPHYSFFRPPQYPLPSLKPTPAWNSGPPVYRSHNSTLPWWLCPDRPENDIHYCSVMEVPMNWLEPKEGEVVKVFMRMYPAEEGKRIGSMLINPGGGFHQDYDR